ncbi:unnamed protein product [Adineta ricciae]|uniref:Uncharacterized protein n=1 Tax=Adineta ricciae TaxID=249248 RepID=A0A813XLP2_ADIRI|nr:unnamed protein product [Adineta ricciae]CAF1338831.1 unnamed protein product [Adineta ricciae]
MTDASNTDETMYYSFRFGKTNKVVQLDQQQLQHFPYLVALVERSQDFISSKNQNDEYVLVSNIRYRWFMIIFQSVIQQQPSILFSRPSEKLSVIGLLQLYEYLCIKSLPLPRFKDCKLVQTHPVDVDEGEKYVKFVRANVGETRNLAAKFVMAVSKNEYDLNDEKTRNQMYVLIMDILSNPTIFNIQFRYHTLVIVKVYCYSSFTKKQKEEMPTAKEISEIKRSDYFVGVNDDDQSLPGSFRSEFAWRVVHISKDEYDAIHSPPDRLGCRINTYPLNWRGWRLDTDNEWFPDAITEWIGLSHHWAIRFHDLNGLFVIENETPLNRSHRKQNREEEAQSARSGRFNTLPKRPKVDKFKHRSGPKAQKHR